jgi:cell division septation protein DedD
LLLFLSLGLVLLCVFCFFLGYSMGHRGTQLTQALGVQPVTGVQASSRVSSYQPKPPATPQNTSSQQRGAGSQPPSKSWGANSSAGQVAIRTIQPGPQPGTTLAPGHSSVQPAPAVKQERATSPAGAPMVQIAAVSHSEDADVLVSALRRRGYSVTARHDPADGLLHVRLGPFSNREEAEKWRLKLLNDGYNAILQP